MWSHPLRAEYASLYTGSVMQFKATGLISHESAVCIVVVCSGWNECSCESVGILRIHHQWDFKVVRCWFVDKQNILSFTNWPKEMKQVNREGGFLSIFPLSFGKTSSIQTPKCLLLLYPEIGQCYFCDWKRSQISVGRVSSLLAICCTAASSEMLCWQ